jgi:TM2 domain-containing membrane protein YozV
LIAIFFAVYPMIGKGYDQFIADFNLQGLIDWISQTIQNLRS